MWKDLVQSLSDKCAFSPPTDAYDVVKAEGSLGVLLPDELKELLSESNGIRGEYGLGLIWSIEQIIKSNLEFRQSTDFKDLYMPFEPLLFFADTGNGDQLAFAILDGVIRWPNIFLWNHENDSRTWIAPSLRTYLEWWASGKLNI